MNQTNINNQINEGNQKDSNTQTNSGEIAKEKFISGYVAIIGRPNVGKSTLLNQLSGIRVAIVSPKPQTTRHNIRAIIDEPNAQIIFIDTPGMHKPKTKLGEYMVDSAYNALNDADVLVLMIDATAPKITDIEKSCCEKAEKFKKPLILLINKVDLISKEELFPIMDRFMKIYQFDAIIPISVKKQDGLDIVKNEIKKRLHEGPQYFPVDSITDQTERTIAAELIREQILRMTNEEIPHGTAVEIELFEERFADAEKSNSTNVDIKIVEKSSKNIKESETTDDESLNKETLINDSIEKNNVPLKERKIKDENIISADKDKENEASDEDFIFEDEEDDEDEFGDDVDEDGNEDGNEDENDDIEGDSDDNDDIEEDEEDDETGERNFVKIQAVIYCEKDSHKRILIGKKGEMIKRIGTQARRQIEEMLQCKVYLELHVKVREDWRNRNPILNNLGYKNQK